MTRSGLSVFGVVAISFVMTSSFCHAEVGERSYTITVDKYIFVMLSRKSLEDEIFWRGDEDGSVRELRSRYPRSGLYLRDSKSVEPLWTVDWYWSGVHVATDGIHLVRTKEAPSLPTDRDLPQRPDLGAEAISFFASGRLLRTYRIEELVSVPDRLLRKEGYFEWNFESWKTGAPANLGPDYKRLEYRLATMDGNQFTFDLRTGAILSETRVSHQVQPEKRGWLWPVGLSIAVTALTIGLIWLRWLRARRIQNLATPGAATGGEGV